MIFIVFKVMDEIENDGTCSIEELKELIDRSGRHIHQDCKYIWDNYSFLSTAVTKMESTTLSLHESLTIFQDVVTNVAAVKCSVGKKIFDAFKTHIKSNPNLSHLIVLDEYFTKIRSALPSDFPISLDDASHYKMALLTSVDVERTFSRFQNIYRENRSFQFENLSKFVFINCNQNFK